MKGDSIQTVSEDVQIQIISYRARFRYYCTLVKPETTYAPETITNKRLGNKKVRNEIFKDNSGTREIHDQQIHLYFISDQAGSRMKI